MQTGKQKISGKEYIFGNETDGSMKSDWIKQGESWYYYGGKDEGDKKNGWQKIKNGTYYLSLETGSMVTGYQRIDNEYYFFKSDGRAMINEWKDCWYYGDDGSLKPYGNSTEAIYYYEKGNSSEHAKYYSRKKEDTDKISLLNAIMNYKEVEPPSEKIEIGDYYFAGSIRLNESFEYYLAYDSEKEVMRVNLVEMKSKYFKITLEEMKQLWDAIEEEETVATTSFDYKEIVSIEFDKLYGFPGERKKKIFEEKEDIKNICEDFLSLDQLVLPELLDKPIGGLWASAEIRIIYQNGEVRELRQNGHGMMQWGELAYKSSKGIEWLWDKYILN